MRMNERFQRLINSFPEKLRFHRLISFLAQLFPKHQQTLIRFNRRAQAYVDLQDASARQHLRTECFEPEFFEIANSLVPPNGVMFDVGANFGLCTFGLLPRRKGQGLHFHLWEPNSRIFSCLEKSRILYPEEDISLWNVALGDRVGKGELTVPSQHWGGARIMANETGGVPISTLDEFLVEKGISRVDLLKLDIEGYEPLFIRGARKSLENRVVRTMYFECSPENLQRYGFSVRDCLAGLREKGYALYWCKPSDMEKRRSLPWVKRSLVPGLPPIDLAPLDDEGLLSEQTDLLAVCQGLS